MKGVGGARCAILGAAVLAAVALPLACRSDGPQEPAPETRPRSYRMGWAPTPPRATTQSVIETAQQMARVSELALVQREVPWTRLLAGESIADVVEDELTGLVEFLRGLDLEIVFLLDPLDGLDRTREPPALVAAGRSIRESTIRALHEAYALEVARQVRPEWFGLASEINTLGAHGDASLYATIVDLINDLAPAIRAASPATRNFVSFQVEDAWQRAPFPPSAVDHFQLIDDFAVDALGLSSYPVFSFDTPAGIPPDYLARFDDATGKPLLMVEGGWSSTEAGAARGSPQEQVDYFRRYAELLDGVRAEAWVMLFYADLDLATFGLPPDRAAILVNFATMGIVDVELRPKPAYAVWDEVFRRPLER